MSENNVIKSIISHRCPLCNGEFFIESQMTPPTISAVFTQKEVDVTKEDCLKRIETLSISDEKKAAVKKWLNDPGTVFGPGETESIILSLLKPEE